MSPLEIDDQLGSPPATVAESLGFFRRHGLWHLVSRNSRATSCRDAAARRTRLGHVGIPLHDELRSLCVVIYSPRGRRFGLLHCRAHCRFDLDAAQRLVGAERPLARLATGEMIDEFAMDYGTVNPFLSPGRFLQVFDADVASKYVPPQTMMTNAGEHTWAVEFRPEEVIRALAAETEVHVGQIVREPPRSATLPVFGLITGNGPESGIALWRHINDVVYARLSDAGRMYGDISYPRVLVHSLPEMGLSMELPQRCEEVWAVLHAAVEQLCAAGATVLAIACNTTQWFADRIREMTEPRGIRFVSMAEVTMEHLRRQGIRDLTILGIPVVAELGDYSAYRPLRDLAVHPLHDRARSHLQELGYLVKRIDRSERDNRALNALQHALRSGVDTGKVLIALTEISVLLQRYPKLKDQVGGKEIIDPLRLQGEALAEIYLAAMPGWTEPSGDAEADDWDER